MKYLLLLLTLGLFSSLVANEKVNFDKGTIAMPLEKLLKDRLSTKSQKEVKTNFSVEMAPMSYLDNTLVIASNDPMYAIFHIKNNNLTPEQIRNGNFYLNIKLPKDFSVIGTTASLSEKISNSNNIYKMALSNEYKTRLILSKEKFATWAAPSVLLDNKAKANKKFSDCQYYITCDDKIVSDVQSFTIKTVPTFSKVADTKYFYAGFSSHPVDLQFLQKKAKEVFAKFVGKLGVKMINSGITVDYIKLFRDNGVRYITRETYPIANGYRMGIAPRNYNKPSNANYIDKDGKVVGTYHGAGPSCPIAIYTKSKYYNDIVKPYIIETIKGLDGFQPNWEPYMFKGKGCFCNQCRAEYAKYANKNEEEIKKDWPQEFVIGGKFYDDVIDFRAEQHGKMIKVLHDEVIAAGGKEIGFAPEVGMQDQIIIHPGMKKNSGEYDVYNYMSYLKWLNIWGPYNDFNPNQFYNYTKGYQLLTLEMARRSIKDIATKIPDPNKRPKLVAMPNGSQLASTMLGLPEWMALEQICFFLAGYDASLLYLFPRGYDHRYWKALADSTALIAENEEIVKTGKKFTDVKIRPISIFPTPAENISPKYLPEIKKSNLLQFEAFEKGDTILVAVGNFWERGDVVFNLQIDNLKPNQEYIVLEKAFNRHFVKDNKTYFTGKDLEKGIALHVGGIRWGFFEISPKISTPKILAVDSKTMQELARKLDKDNFDAFEKDKSYQGADSDIGEIKTIFSNGIKMLPVKIDNLPMIRVKHKQNTFLLNPKGFYIEKWVINGENLISPSQGCTAFYSPGKLGRVLSYNFRIVEQTVTKDGAKLVGELKTNTRNFPLLPDLKITKTIITNKDLSKISIDVKLENTTGFVMGDVGYRWRIFPTSWLVNNKNGYIKMGDKTFKRLHNYAVFVSNGTADSVNKVSSMFKANKVEKTKIDNIFNAKISDKLDLKLEFFPKNEFGGLAVWDNSRVEIGTFEPFYNLTQITPKSSIKYTVKMEAIKH